MCIKTIYIDTYPDGTQKTWELVETCRPGTAYMCEHPRTKEVRRLVPGSSSGGHGHSRPMPSSRPSSGIDFMRLPPSPRLTPSPRLSPRLSPRHSPTPSSEARHRRDQRAGISTFVNGEKVYERDLGHRSPRAHVDEPHHHHHHHGHSTRTRDPRVVEIIQPGLRSPRFMPEAPSAPRLSRSSTMPTHQEYVVIREPRHSIPIPPPAPAMPASIPVPGLSRHASAAYPSHSHNYCHRHRHAAPTNPIILVDDERQRAERHRRREARRSSMYGTTPTRTPTSPAVAAVHKELRWEDEEDEERRVQNARIANRPPKLYQEVRGILKTPSSPTAARPAVEVVVPERERLAELRRGMSGLGISGGTAEERLRARREERDMKDRLAARFARSNGSRVYYPGEGLYKYL